MVLEQCDTLKNLNKTAYFSKLKFITFFQILSLWILKLVFMWSITNANGNVKEVGYKDAEFILSKNDPSTHMELAEVKRLARSSEFDRGYEEFLRNYRSDNNIGNRGGHYRVEESDENASYAHEEDDDDTGNESNEAADTTEADDDYDSESESKSLESNETRKSYIATPQTEPQRKSVKKSKNENKSKKSNDSNNKSKKQCKMEKRDGMLCTVCYNPISDEKSESCSYSSEPKEDNYAYSEDKSYGGKKREPESLEGGDSDENGYEFKGQTDISDRKNPPSNKYPIYSTRKPKPTNKYFPFASFLPFANQKYGPQTFTPNTFHVAHARRRPTRYQTKILSPNVTLIRYRTVETPFTSERIRLIVPTASQNRPIQPKLQKNRSSPIEVRPPREVNGAQTESLLSNVTKKHEFEYLPAQLNDEASHHKVKFTNKDGLKCKKSIDNDKVCFECYMDDGERRKECKLSRTNKPTRFFESYTSSKKSKHSLGEYDSAPSTKAKHSRNQLKYKPKSHSTKQDNNKKQNLKSTKTDGHSNVHPISEELVYANVEKRPIDTKVEWNTNHSQKQSEENPPKSQPYRVVPEIIYGTPHSNAESMTIYYPPIDPVRYTANSSSSTIHLNY